MMPREPDDRWGMIWPVCVSDEPDGASRTAELTGTRAHGWLGWVMGSAESAGERK